MRLSATLLACAAVLLPCAAADAAKTSPRPKPNTGLTGSRCVTAPLAGPGAPALDTAALGVLPAPYEVGPPGGLLGRLEGVRRVMLFVHGGGWYTVGDGAMHTMRGQADAWRAAGWATVNADYRSCRRSAGGVVALYDRVRARFGPGVPVCVMGESAGGHLALLLAARRPDVACVIALGAPTDLWTIRRQGAAAAASGAPAALADGSRFVRGLARAAFGRAGLAQESPATHAASITGRLLLASASDDVLVPLEQAQQLADAVRAARPDAYAEVVRLEPGEQRFVHGTARAASMDDYERRVAAVVAPFGRAPSSAPPVVSLLDRLTGWLRPRRR